MIAAAAILLIVVFYLYNVAGGTQNIYCISLVLFHVLLALHQFGVFADSAERCTQVVAYRQYKVTACGQQFTVPVVGSFQFHPVFQSFSDVMVNKQPEKEIFHPGRTVEDTARSFLPMAEKKGLGLTTEVTGSDVLVEGDCGRLVQILNNLLSNAIKFTRTGYIHVGARYQDGKLYLFVRDTGIGIDKERQERIFTAFERGETSDAQQGFGLGLAITYKLVNAVTNSPTFRQQSHSTP